MRGRPTTGAMGAAAPGPGGAATLASATAVRGPSLVSASAPGGGSKRDRQGTIRALVAAAGIGSQQELVDQLNDRGFAVTQATVSRDIAELGLLKAPRADGPVYVSPEDVASQAPTPLPVPPFSRDDRLRRILTDVPVTIGRSGLILVLTGTPGTASVVAQAIDESSLQEQEGTLAGDNTLLVLFADDARLATWRERFDDIRTSAVTGSLGGPLIP